MGKKKRLSAKREMIIKGLKELTAKAESGGDVHLADLLRLFGKVDEVKHPVSSRPKHPDGYCRKFKNPTFGCSAPCPPHKNEVPECAKCLWWEPSSVLRMERVKEGNA